jgi:hypothetical protein
MAERLKWFLGERITPDSLKLAAKQMLEWKYSEQGGWGFLLNEIRPRSIDGRFIERLVLKEEVVDPVGMVRQYERIIFQETSFLLRHEPPHLELRNAPRSVTTFLNQLGRAFDFAVAITPVQLNVMRFLSSLENRANGLTVSRITICDMAVAVGVEAKCVLVGEHDVRRHVRAFTAKRKFQVSSIAATFVVNGIEMVGEINADGRVVISNNLSTELRTLFRELVREALREQIPREGS